MGAVNGNGNGNGNGRLTGKQQAFVNAYCGEAKFNATKAAELAGYQGNYDTLSAVGSENLRNPKIEKKVKQFFAAFAMTAGEVLMHLGEIGRGEWADYVLPNGDVDIARIVEDDKAHLIAEIWETREGKRVKFYDRLTALSMIGKHLGMFVDRHALTDTEGHDLLPADALVSALLAARKELVSDEP